MVIAVLVGMTAVVSLVALGAGHFALRRRRVAQAEARQDSYLRRAARKAPAECLVVDPTMHWVPDLEHGGWRLAGRYLPTTGEEASLDGSRRRRRGR